MAKVFDLNNPVWRFMGRLADVFVLTVLWTVCSLPVITAGAATTALYDVALKMAEGQDGYYVRNFFRAFRENFLQSTLIWLVMLAVGGLLGTSLWFYYRTLGQWAVVVFWLLLVLAVVAVFVFAMVFPLAARLEAGVGKLFFLAFMVSLKHFSWVFLMVTLTGCLLAAGIFVFWPLLLFFAGGAACINAQILVRAVFPKYGWTRANNLK